MNYSIIQTKTRPIKKYSNLLSRADFCLHTTSILPVSKVWVSLPICGCLLTRIWAPVMALGKMQARKRLYCCCALVVSGFHAIWFKKILCLYFLYTPWCALEIWIIECLSAPPCHNSLTWICHPISLPNSYFGIPILSV